MILICIFCAILHRSFFFHSLSWNPNSQVVRVVASVSGDGEVLLQPTRILCVKYMHKNSAVPWQKHPQMQSLQCCVYAFRLLPRTDFLTWRRCSSRVKNPWGDSDRSLSGKLEDTWWNMVRSMSKCRINTRSRHTFHNRAVFSIFCYANMISDVYIECNSLKLC